MKKRELMKLGVPGGKASKLAQEGIQQCRECRMNHGAIRARIQEVVAAPHDYTGDPHFGPLARELANTSSLRAAYHEREVPAPYSRWGDGLDPKSERQMYHACRLPVSVAGALMPDAHVGYGLPIGGVLATRKAVIPYAVGVDIACRMKMTVLDMPVSSIRGSEGQMRNVLEQQTRFGIGAEFKEQRRDHPVLNEDWSFSPVTRRMHDKAWRQLGSSGSGNHFVEFGKLTLEETNLGLAPGEYVALLSHSGSRGPGAQVAQHYSRMAMDVHAELPRELIHLAWLDLDGDSGQEYWHAMELMGRYAAANHELIHRHIAKALKVGVLLDIENHHNFAWKESHFGEDVVVHRKGATPAGKGTVGIIPGSMAAPGFVVRGRGSARSMNSAAHGAGRAMSRTAAKRAFSWSEAQKLLAERDVVVISAGLDEVPMAYKDIESVMASQADLVEILARFDPMLVKMAPAGEPAED